MKLAITPCSHFKLSTWFTFLQTATDSTICTVSPSQTDMDNDATSKEEILTPELKMAEEKINRSGESTILYL